MHIQPKKRFRNENFKKYCKMNAKSKGSAIKKFSKSNLDIINCVETILQGDFWSKISYACVIQMSPFLGKPIS